MANKKTGRHYVISFRCTAEKLTEIEKFARKKNIDKARLTEWAVDRLINDKELNK